MTPPWDVTVPNKIDLLHERKLKMFSGKGRHALHTLTLYKNACEQKQWV